MSSKDKTFTEENSSVIKEMLFNEKFIKNINSLSKAILEFYKVSKNIYTNKELLINFGKKEINIDELTRNNKINKKSENMKINVRELIKTLNEIFIKLEINNKSQQINLSNFFEDAKIIFKRLRENRQEIISKMKQPSISCAKKNLSEQKLTNIFKKKRANNIDDRNKYNLVNSCINLDLNDFQNSNQNILTEENGMKKLYGKNTRGKSKPNLFLVDEYSPDMNYLNTLPDFPKNNTQRNILNFNKEEFEIQKLIMQNKKLSMELAKYKSFINDGMNNKNMYNMNNFKKINIFIKDKDKDISQLKQEKYQTNNRYQKEVNKHNTEIVQLNQENEQIKTNSYISSNNSKIDFEKSIILKMNKLMQENKQLKDNIEELKMHYVHSYVHSEFNMNVDNYLLKNDNLGENKTFLNKIIILEKKLNQKQKENTELSSKLINLKKKYEDKISVLSKKYNELTNNLINNQNKLINLQKESLNKNVIKDSLQHQSIKDTNGMQNLNSNENLDKIKKEYENKISTINKKVKELELIIEKVKKSESELNKQLSTLKKQIMEKDRKIKQLNYQIEELKSELLTKQSENQILSDNITNLELQNQNNDNINNNDILNEELIKEKDINNNLTEELNKIKQNNIILQNKLLSKEKKLTNLSIINNELEKREKEIEILKNENSSLKFENEQFKFKNNELKECFLNEENKNYIMQKNENEGLKQMIEKMQKEREKDDNELNMYKRENEKIKNQLIRLSKTLPEEYNELQKQYKSLEGKYLNLKNKNPNNQTSKNTKSEEKNEDKKDKELLEAKKEIEQLKKKNVELFTQLEDKEINKNFYDNRSEDANKSNYEEEFDLRKMAKGARDKNRSQDVNIDYPGLQNYKEKVRELEFYYNSLENLVKKLLLTIQCNPKNKTYVNELCKIVGFDSETTNKIITNKNKNFILGLFSKQ